MQHEREGVGQGLQRTLQELIDLSLIGKQLHWAVVGPRFAVVDLGDQLENAVGEKDWRKSAAPRDRKARSAVSASKLCGGCSDSALDGFAVVVGAPTTRLTCAAVCCRCPGSNHRSRVAPAGDLRC